MTRFHTNSDNVELFDQPSLKKRKADKADADDADNSDNPAQDSPIEYVDKPIVLKFMKWEQVNDRSGLSQVKDMVTSTLLRLSLLSGGGPSILDVTDAKDGVYAKVGIKTGLLHLIPYAASLTTQCPLDG